MALIFQVSDVNSVYTPEYARAVVKALKPFGYENVLDKGSKEFDFKTEDLGWSWLEELHSTVRDALGEAQVPHLLFADAWHSVYLPLDLMPCVVQADLAGPLRCASLPKLLEELHDFANEKRLPIRENSIKAFLQRYIDEIECDADDDPDLQCYGWLMLSALEATKRGLPVWVVK